MFVKKRLSRSLSIIAICMVLFTLFMWVYQNSQEPIKVVEKIEYDGRIEVLEESTIDLDAAPVEKLGEIKKILANNAKLRNYYTLESDSDSILILTPIKDGANYLSQYFSLIDKLQYPRNSISIAFLVSDSTDNTQQILLNKQKWYQEKGPVEQRFKRFEIYRKDFFYILPRNQRHKFNTQRERRTVMARARNYLWTRALENEQWVVWIDSDLKEYPSTIIKDLMAYNKDIIVPICMLNKTKPGGPIRHVFYDYNAWQETDASRKMLAGLKDTDFLAEDAKYIKTGRKYLSKFQNQEIVPLDGIGGTFTLVKSYVHRSGVGFPTWLVEHQVETEGFAKLAKINGFGVYGLPSYRIIHAG
ncbi:hypothetical protein COEREDRAFT_80830 [Coemansia reversa NRRL 1564]|uniref:Anp1-domain-containing protein n=1 Tax=Coemansia reversa (strain ATCC 12441 / NRRL 1564) TaxID=763665 RepID=A0A2G5BDS2_COERN|nr:hypothetical protein COEREDRAFT_80830 [Coemansia reversa NRRL 1564]|eukprot:PIA17132.1 hypothetical protein COEREDRAFT_80830 [Coemansia reversa NRRL 1564]